jgi:hypothetical protein
VLQLEKYEAALFQNNFLYPHMSNSWIRTRRQMEYGSRLETQVLAEPLGVAVALRPFYAKGEIEIDFAINLQTWTYMT